MPDRPSGRLLLLGCLYLLLLLAPAGFLPLMETTEARYAEIAREMVVSGNYLEPHFNGIKHFHKPPLTYWAIAGGLKLFGVNDFGARFFSVVAAGLAVFYLFRLARLVLGDEGKAIYATCIFATSGLFLAVSRIVSTDIYLTCFTIIAQYYLFRRLAGDRRRRTALLYAFALGLGFLTKGPIIFLFTLVPFLVAKLFDRGHRNLFTWGEMLQGLLVFLTVSLPWYLAVCHENPGLLGYFLKVQTVDRVVTNRFHRDEPAWYFLGVFLAGFFPYVFFFLRGLFSVKALPRQVSMLLVYIAVPLVVFSLARSKMATYILPFFGVAALFTAEVLSRFRLGRCRWWTLLSLALVTAALAASGFLYRPVRDARFLLAAIAILAAGTLVQAYRNLAGERFLVWCGGAFLLICSAGICGAVAAGPELKNYEAVLGKINEFDPQRRLQVMVYEGFLPSVSFYRGDLAVMAHGEERETQFEEDASFRLQYLPTDTEIAAFLAERQRLFVISKPDKFKNFLSSYPFKCDTIFVQRKHTAYLCEKSDPPIAPDQQE